MNNIKTFENFNNQDIFTYLKNNDIQSIKNYIDSGYDLNIQISTIIGSNITSGIGAAVYVAIISAIYKKNLKAGLAVLGNVSIGGAIERSLNFADKVTMLSENGAKTVLVPMDNLGEITTLPSSILGKTDTPFYGNSQMLFQKSLISE